MISFSFKQLIILLFCFFIISSCGGGSENKSPPVQQETTLIAIESHLPLTSEVNVSEDISIEIIFDSNIEKSYISIVLSQQSNSNLIEGDIVLDSNRAIFSPSKLLIQNTNYDVVVNYNSVGAPLKQYKWSFTTAQLEAPEGITNKSFYPTIETSGITNFSIVPTETVKANQLTKVSFGIPFPKGYLNNIHQFKILDDTNTEVEIAVKEILPWRNGKGERASVRSVLVQLELEFESNKYGRLNSRFFTLQWGINRTITDIPIESARNSWVLVDDEEFSASDNVYEPQAYALFQPSWYGDSVIKTRLLPLGSHPDFSAYDTSFKLFGDTAINNVDPRVTDVNLIQHRESYAAWLFDRAMTIYQLAFRTGEYKYLRAAHRASQFYLQQINSEGYFGLKTNNDMKYSYGESLIADYMLFGDERIPETIVSMIPAWDSFNTQYTLSSNFWTERHAAFQLLGYVVAYEISGDKGLIEKLKTTFSILQKMQQTPETGLPVTGGLMHTSQSHSEGGDFIIASPWMSALLIDALERYYINFEEPEVVDFVLKMADFFKQENISLYEWQEWDGNENHFVPRYLVSLDNLGDYGGDNDAEHTLDVSKIFSLAYFFSCKYHICDESFKNVNEKLYQTANSYTLPKWIRPAAPSSGLTSYRLAPPRKFNWWFRISANNDFLQNGEISTYAKTFSNVEIVQTVKHEDKYKIDDEITIRYQVKTNVDIKNLVIKSDLFKHNPTNSVTLLENNDKGILGTDGLIWFIPELNVNDDVIELSFTVKVSDFDVLQKTNRPIGNLLFYADIFYCATEDSAELCKIWENEWSKGQHTHKGQSEWYYIAPEEPISTPQLTINAPLDGDLIDGEQKIIVDVKDEDGVKKLDIYLDDGFLTSLEEEPYEFPFQYNSLSVGDHIIRVDAWDSYGSLATESVSIRAKSPDEVAPQINILSPIENGIYCHSAPVQYQVTDQFGVKACNVYFKETKKEIESCNNIELSGIAPLFDAKLHFSFDHDDPLVTSSNEEIKGEMFSVERIESPFTKGLSFNRDDSKVKFEEGIFDLENELTISFWLYPTRDKGVILSQGWSYIGIEYGWAISLGANNHENNHPMSITWSSGDNVGNLNEQNVIQTDADTLVFGKWQHIVVRKKDKLVDIFYNGELITSKSLASAKIAWPYNIDKALSFAMPMSHPDMYNRTYQGGLDEVSIWNRPLSNAEVNDLFNRNILIGTQIITIEAIDKANNTSKEMKKFTFSNCVN